MLHSSTVPQRKKVLAVYGLREATGWGAPRISRETGIPVSTISLWLSKPHVFDPFYDDVAVARALDGDAEVFGRLTVFEYKLVVALLERADAAGDPVTERFPSSHKEKVRKAICKRRNRIEGPRPKTHRIAELKLTPEMCAKAKAMRRNGIDFAIIGRQLGLSRSSVFRAIRAAA